jgi:hypothetical protein
MQYWRIYQSLQSIFFALSGLACVSARVLDDLLNHRHVVFTTSGECLLNLGGARYWSIATIKNIHAFLDRCLTCLRLRSDLSFRCAVLEADRSRARTDRVHLPSTVRARRPSAHVDVFDSEPATVHHRVSVGTRGATSAGTLEGDAARDARSGS